MPDATVTVPGRTDLPAILHVDDDPDMLRVLSSVFEGKAELYSTPSLEEARTAAGRSRFDAAILDIGLADGNGLELVSLLRQRDVSIPILVFSAQEIDPSHAAGVDLVMVKSRASMDSLVEQMMNMIAQRQAAAAP